MADELPGEVDVDELEELEGTDDTPALDDEPSEDDSTKDSDGDDESAQKPAALDELEAEELEMLTEDESEETIVVDEAAEMRAIRRAEIALEGEVADSAKSDEFVCASCFLVKRRSQMANKRKKICFDCAG